MSIISFSFGLVILVPWFSFLVWPNIDLVITSPSKVFSRLVFRRVQITVTSEIFFLRSVLASLILYFNHLVEIDYNFYFDNQGVKIKILKCEYG